jgi:hypothetical protein
MDLPSSEANRDAGHDTTGSDAGATASVVDEQETPSQVVMSMQLPATRGAEGLLWAEHPSFARAVTRALRRRSPRPNNF